MYSPETIAQIHNQLQALDSSALVLLGGSYVYGEAGEESDVDFYFICPLWRLFFLGKLKQSVKDLKKRFPEVDFSVMIVPHWLKHYGYYLYGKDANGKIHTWAVPKRTLIRNCLKLAYFNYLRFLVLPSPRGRGTDLSAVAPSGAKVEGEGSERNLMKVKKQLAVANLAAEGKIDFNKPIFSWEYIREHQSQNPPSRGAHGGCETDAPFTAGEQLAKHGSHTPPNALRGTPLDGGFDQRSTSQLLLKAFHQFLPYFTFSFSNYLLYNARFLLRSNPLFLFKNPDKMIIKRLKEGFDQHEDPASLYREIKEIIFPVIII